MINKVIKIHMRLSHTIVYVFLLSLSYSVFSQTQYLPEKINLSFNGKFIAQKGNPDFRNVSDNGLYGVTYDIGKVTDEQREILNFKCYEQESLLYSLEYLPGSDVYVSNNGYIAVMNMKFHFKQELTVIIINKHGKEIYRAAYKYASLFGFSPSGNKFVVGTDKKLSIIDLKENQTPHLEPCSKFAFSKDETIIATARENKLNIYEDYQLQETINTDLFYPRGLVISSNNDNVAIIGKKELKIYSFEGQLINENKLAENLSYRDLRIWNNKILAGVHYKHNGTSKGILQIHDFTGEIIESKEMAVKNYKTFDESPNLKSTTSYDPIPWPFFPFDTIHKVWNHYEQHMGYGSGDLSYLHQGLDIEVPINEPTYAVEEGWVKLVLTLGSASYWRVAVSPVQVSGYSDGWLYAHLVESSIQVDVGDYVQLHDYLGDIIYWANDWGHIHFVNIKDHGEIWYYEDDEWGINFNPLLALTPNTDSVVPVIEDFSAGSKFGFYVNETSNYLDPDDLYGDVDIVVKISEYHADSEWEQPAFKTYYWLNKLPEDTTIFPKTLGQILNHSYPFYSSTNYYPYADIIYKKDYYHPPPPWMNYDRDYYQILTNNNGDSIIDLSEAQLAFPTENYPDGEYRIFVEAWDEAGNMALDSMDITFDNFNTGISNSRITNSIEVNCFPNPAKDYVVFEVRKVKPINQQIIITNTYGQQIELLSIKNEKTVWDIRKVSSGTYFYYLQSGLNAIERGKIIVLK
jgi:murein DD-endopeptidase MepM/ murein hydrolase activator NlpD